MSPEEINKIEEICANNIDSMLDVILPVIKNQIKLKIIDDPDVSTEMGSNIIGSVLISCIGTVLRNSPDHHVDTLVTLISFTIMQEFHSVSKCASYIIEYPKTEEMH